MVEWVCTSTLNHCIRLLLLVPSYVFPYLMSKFPFWYNFYLTYEVLLYRSLYFTYIDTYRMSYKESLRFSFLQCVIYIAEQ